MKYLIIFLVLIGVALTFSSLTLIQSFSEITYSKDPHDFDKQDCELLALDHWQPTEKGREISKKWLDVCIERGLITSEIAELAESVSSFSTRDKSAAYRFSNGDIEETIKILQHPNYPKNVFDPVLKAYDDLNNRLVVEPEFAKLLQTEVVGFGVDEQNKGIFISIDPTYANQENFNKYEEIFRETIGEDMPIKFEVHERADSDDKTDFDFRILILIIIAVSLSAALYYFWRKRK